VGFELGELQEPIRNRKEAELAQFHKCRNKKPLNWGIVIKFYVMYPRHNPVWKIWWRSLEGFWPWLGSNFRLFHWLAYIGRVIKLELNLIWFDYGATLNLDYGDALYKSTFTYLLTTLAGPKPTQQQPAFSSLFSNWADSDGGKSSGMSFPGGGTNLRGVNLRDGQPATFLYRGLPSKRQSATINYHLLSWPAVNRQTQEK